MIKKRTFIVIFKNSNWQLSNQRDKEVKAREAKKFHRRINHYKENGHKKIGASNVKSCHITDNRKRSYHITDHSPCWRLTIDNEESYSI
jgi:hypothetical protein